MFSLKFLVRVSFLLMVLLVAACVRQTPAPGTESAATQPVAAPTNAEPPGGYPAGPTITPLPTGAYPAEQGGGAADAPAPTSTVAASATAAASDTPAPTETAAPAATAAPVFVTYRDFEIVPAKTTIKAGTQVTFLIKGSLHQPYNFIAPNTFESPPNLGDGTAYSFTFNETGSTTILCGYHPNMTATVEVTP